MEWYCWEHYSGRWRIRLRMNCPHYSVENGKIFIITSMTILVSTTESIHSRAPTVVPRNVANQSHRNFAHQCNTVVKLFETEKRLIKKWKQMSTFILHYFIIIFITNSVTFNFFSFSFGKMVMMEFFLTVHTSTICQKLTYLIPREMWLSPFLQAMCCMVFKIEQQLA